MEKAIVSRILDDVLTDCSQVSFDDIGMYFLAHLVHRHKNSSDNAVLPNLNEWLNMVAFF